jgi:copper transport protein
MGAVASLAIAVWPSRAAERRDALALAVAIRRPFAVLAGASALAVTTTGLYAAGLEVPSVHALVASLYGQTLLAKTGVAALALTLGATNFVLLQVVERTRIRRVVWQLIAAEAAAGALALLAAAVLTASAPARGSPTAAPRPVVPRTLTRQVEDLVMSTTVRPNRPGANAFAVVAASTRRPAPAPIRSMQLRIGGSGRIVPLHYVPGRGWFATALLNRPGLARMTLVVRRPRLDVVAPFSWTVEQPDPSQALVPSSLRLASIVNPAALLLLVCGVLAAAVPALARQRSLHHRPRTTAEEPS